jgi:hypothetical protein
MTQPQPVNLPINILAMPAQAPDGTQMVQLRIIVGPSCWLLEMPVDAAQQVRDLTAAQLDNAITAVRRAQLGVPGLIVPTNGSARP